jgi:glutamate N-acetyltransferase/amino-acid N-acetyltransferase
MSVVAASGFVAGGLACGIKESGAADLAVVATEDRAPAIAAGVFRPTAPPPGADQHAAPADGRAAAVVLNFGTPTPRLVTRASRRPPHVCIDR